MPATTTHNSASSTYDEDIAIIGIDLKFPGDASTPEGFQKLLLEGRSALSDIGKERYNIDAFYHPDPERAGAVSNLWCSKLSQSLMIFLDQYS